MLTNPSPNARTPRAVSRRRTLRRARSELLIGGAADVDVFQKLRGTLGALERVSPEMGLWGGWFRLCWTMVVVSSQCPRRRLVGDFPRGRCQRVPRSDSDEDPSRLHLSGHDVRPGVE